MTPPPLQFLFGLHVHQPVGNFDHVFADHVEDVYLPFLSALAERINPVFLPRPLYKVESLPRNAMGKLPREALSRLLADLRNAG